LVLIAKLKDILGAIIIRSMPFHFDAGLGIFHRFYSWDSTKWQGLTAFL